MILSDPAEHYRRLSDMDTDHLAWEALRRNQAYLQAWADFESRCPNGEELSALYDQDPRRYDGCLAASQRSAAPFGRIRMNDPLGRELSNSELREIERHALVVDGGIVDRRGRGGRCDAAQGDRRGHIPRSPAAAPPACGEGQGGAYVGAAGEACRKQRDPDESEHETRCRTGSRRRHEYLLGLVRHWYRALEVRSSFTRSARWPYRCLPDCSCFQPR